MDVLATMTATLIAIASAGVLLAINILNSPPRDRPVVIRRTAPPARFRNRR